MPELSYPSFLFPERPSFTIDLPDGWEPDFVDNAEFAAKAPDGSAFTPNLVVTIKRVPGQVAIEAVAAGVGASLSGLPAAQVFGRQAPGTVEILASPGFTAEVSFQAPDGRRVFQTVAVAAYDQGSCTDIVTFIVTATLEQAQTRIGEYRAILDSAQAVEPDGDDDDVEFEGAY